MHATRSMENGIRSLCGTLLLLTPLVFSPYWYRYRDLKWACLLVLGLAVLGMVFQDLIRYPSHRSRIWDLPRPLILPLGLLLAWDLVGLLRAVDLQTGLERVFQDAVLLGLLGVFYALGKTKRHRDFLLKVVLGSGLLVSLFSLYQKVGGTIGLQQFYDARMRRYGIGPFGNPNFLAHYLVVVVLLGLGVTLASFQHRTKAFWLAVLIVLIGGQALLLTESRGGYIAVGLTGIGLLIYSMMRNRKRIGWIVLLAAALLAVNLTWLPQTIAGKLGPDVLSNRFRLQAYPDALRMIAHNPLGIGRGQTERVFPLFRTPRQDMPERARASHLHCDPLEWVAEWGLPGCALGIWILLAIGKIVRKNLQQGDQQGVPWLAATVGLSIHSLVSFPLHNPTPSLLWIVGLAMALSKPEKPEQPGCASAPMQPIYYTVAVTLLPALVLFTQVYFALIPLQASCLHRQAISVAAEKEAEALYEATSRLPNVSLDLLYDGGQFYLQREDPWRARRFFEQYLNHFPNNSRALFNLGSAALRSGDKKTAQEALQRAHALDPYHPPTLALLAAIETEQGQFEEAERLLQQLIRLKPDSASAHYNLAVLYHRQGKRDLAEKHGSIAFRLDPSYQPAKNLLELLKSSNLKIENGGN